MDSISLKLNKSKKQLRGTAQPHISCKPILFSYEGSDFNGSNTTKINIKELIS